MIRVAATFLISAALLVAGITGSISGTLKDPSGAVIPRVMLTLTNALQGIHFQAMTDQNGYYIFPSLPVGRYDLKIEASGFMPWDRNGLVVDANSAIKLDITMEMGEKLDTVTVSESANHLETESTQLGDVVTSTRMTVVALNGRSFTDLLALQPGIVPMTTQQPDSIVMAGASVAIAPSGSLNPGNQSISGQREDANGFMVNGGDVKELMNGGTSIVPNLDSIAEFRILTNNFDAEYGNYSGGIVNVVTKSGSNELHGSGFEFLRNTALDARNFFSPERSFYRQNQFGGTVGGPIRRRTSSSSSATIRERGRARASIPGLIPVPSLADRTGNLSDLGGIAHRHAWADRISRIFCRRNSATPCPPTSRTTRPVVSRPAQCVFPNAVIPQRAWSAPAKHLLQYIPAPNVGRLHFFDGVGRQDSARRQRQLPRGRQQRALGTALGLLFLRRLHAEQSLSDRAGRRQRPRLRRAESGPLAADQSGPDQDLRRVHGERTSLELYAEREQRRPARGRRGPEPRVARLRHRAGNSRALSLWRPSIEGIENVTFNSFVIGTPITNLTQANNTYALDRQLLESLGQPQPSRPGFSSASNRSTSIPIRRSTAPSLSPVSETGSDFADFLIGVASNYNQADSQTYYGRHKYAAAFVQDSWRARPNLTLNFGLRWDLMQYWSEKYNQIPTFILGRAIQGLSDGAHQPGLSDRPGRPEYAGAARQSLFAAAGLGLFARQDGRTAGQDHRRARQNQHPRRLRHLLFGDSGQHHRHRRAAASLWLELYQLRHVRCSRRLSSPRRTARSTCSRFR